MADPISVTGGAAGTYAMLGEIEALAKLSEEAGAGLATVRSNCHDVVLDGDVLRSAVLNPEGFARFQATLLEAIDGPQGLTWLAAELQAHGPLLRRAANAYRALDQGSARLIDSVLWVGGVAGVGLGAAGLAALAASLAANPLTAPLVVGGGYLAGSRVDWTRVITDNPTAVQGIIRSLPGTIATLQVGAGVVLGPVLAPLVVGPIATDVQSGARVVGMLYPDGEPQVVRAQTYDPTQGRFIDVVETDPRITQPPRNFSDVLNAYDYRNAQAQAKLDGQVDVRVVTQDNGQRAYIVDIPGTYASQTNPLPLRDPAYYQKLNDMSTNIHALGGEQTAYAKGVAEALRQAGYQPGSGVPIMLVGHSQGGIVAAQAVSDPEFRDQFKVTHVLTAGSPVGNFKLPPDVQGLSIENRHDIIPQLDGRNNPDQRNWTTVTIADQRGGELFDNHSMSNVYAPVGRYIDSTDNPSVEAYRNSAGAFFNGSVQNNVFRITRDVPQAPSTTP